MAAALSAGELIWMFEKRLPPTGWLGVIGAAACPIAAWLWTAGGKPLQDWAGVVGAGAVVALLVTAMLQRGELAQAPRSAALAALAWVYAGPPARRRWWRCARGPAGSGWCSSSW